MYKMISGRDSEQLERLLNKPEVKQVINFLVLNGTFYALIEVEEPKEPVSKPKATTSKPRKPRKKSTD